MKRFTNILFVADLEADNVSAYKQAIAIAKQNQARITVVGVVNTLDVKRLDTETTKNKLQEAMVAFHLETLQNLIQSNIEKELSIDVKILEGRDFIEIIQEVIKQHHDLLIKPVKAPSSIRDKLFSSLDNKLIRKCPCPVWLIKPMVQKGYRQVLVGLDYDPDNIENEALSKQLLEAAIGIAIADGSDLHIVHAWKLPHESFLRSPRTGFTDMEVDHIIQTEENKRRLWLEQLVEDYIERLGTQSIHFLNPKISIINGDARFAITEYAEQEGVELIVLGTVSRTGLPGYFIGNTAESVLNQIKCSVLTIKPEGFISPVALPKQQ